MFCSSSHWLILFSMISLRVAPLSESKMHEVVRLNKHADKRFRPTPQYSFHKNTIILIFFQRNMRWPILRVKSFCPRGRREEKSLFPPIKDRIGGRSLYKLSVITSAESHRATAWTVQDIKQNSSTVCCGFLLLAQTFIHFSLALTLIPDWWAFAAITSCWWFDPGEALSRALTGNSPGRLLPQTATINPSPRLVKLLIWKLLALLMGA